MLTIHGMLEHWKLFILCFLKKCILSPDLSMVVLMLWGVGWGGGGGVRALLSSLRVPPSFCITGLSIAVTWLWHLFVKPW